MLRADEDEIDLSKLPPAATRPVDFLADIQPILENNCLRCHGPEKPKSRFRLDNRASALEGGASGIAIIPGSSAESPLIHYVARLVEDMEMPPEGKGDPLTGEQIGLLRAWIDTGALWSTQSIQPKSDVTVSPYFAWIDVSGDEQNFREHFWRKGGGGGGVEHFRLHDQLDPNRSVTVEGHAFSHNSDYKVRLSLDQRGFGFTRLGFQQVRRYYDDSGGYYEPFPVPQFDLGRDLYLDVGRFWAEVGLTLPDRPQAVLGYEYHYRDGTKSLLGWGAAQSPGIVGIRQIYPTAKDVDEQLHIVRFDVTHTLAGIDVEDNFRFEDYDLKTERGYSESFLSTDPGPSQSVRVGESERHDRVANAFSVRKQVKEWWMVSGGHFYSHIDANSALNSRTLDGALQPTVGTYWTTDNIVLERTSHYFNFNNLFTPLNHLSISIGSRCELTSQDAMGKTKEGATFNDPSVPFADVESSVDKLSFQEDAIVRYTAIPFTVLYAETRHSQEAIDHLEEQVGGNHDLLRDTDTDVRRAHYRAGVDVSPWTWISLHGSYTRRDNRNRYDHERDDPPPLNPAISGTGYSAFIRSHDFESDEVEVKLVAKPVNWIRATLSYRLLASDYETDTDGVSIPIASLVIVPGGSHLSGNYDAHIYSAGLILTPLRRLYTSITVSYSDSRTVTAVGGSPSVVPYSGDIYTVVATANYALDQKTDCFGSYAFSLADYRQQVSDGLALGTGYRQDAFQAGLTRRITANLAASLRYGYFRYDDISRSGLNDYTAHAIFTTLALSLP